MHPENGLFYSRKIACPELHSGWPKERMTKVNMAKDDQGRDAIKKGDQRSDTVKKDDWG